MRLRLRIERNELPAVRTLWPVSEVETKHTIAQLLEKVNSRFPLESEHWGLEHYKVSVGGYECLHYHEIGAVCKDEDELVIRPLQTAEVRARTLLGRDQITMDGRHLIDGIPFGRPLLREPRRAQVRIPPPKRQKLDHPTILRFGVGNAAADDDDEALGGEDGESELESDDEDDESFHDDGEDEITTEEEDADADAENEEPKQIDFASGGDDNDISSDSSSEVSTTSDESQDTSDSDSDASDTSSWDGIASPKKSVAAQAAPYRHKDQPAKNVPPGLGNSQTKERNRRRRDSKRLEWLKTNGHLPQEADFAALAEYEALHGRSTKLSSTAANGAESAPSPSTSQVRASKQEALERKRQELLAQLASGGVDVTEGRRASIPDDDDEPPEEISTRDETANGTSKETELSSARRNRLDLAGTNRLLFGSLGVRVPKSHQEKDALQKKLAGRTGRNETAVGTPAQARVQSSSNATVTPGAANHATEQDDEAWREKIDLRAIECVDEGVTFSTPPFPFYQRWDPQQRKKKNRSSDAYMTSTKRRKTGTARGDFVETYDKYNQNGGSDALDYDDEDEDYWEEGALLGDEADDDDLASQQLLEETQNGASTDPVAEGKTLHVDAARWDSNSKANVIKLLEANGPLADFKTIDHIFDTSASIHFETASEARRAMHVLVRWHASVNAGPLLIPTPGAEHDSDFPPPPKELPVLTTTADQPRPYDFLVYRELVVSMATNWQPSFVLRTVRLVEWIAAQNAWRVQRPLRDQPPIEHDEEGNRVYSKFEMEGYEDEDQSTDLMNWEQLADEKGLGHLLIDWEIAE